MEILLKFIQEHIDDDTTRLILDRDKWPDTDIELAVNCIESRRKLKGKVREWHENPRLIFPVKLSAEQCSSDATASHKASIAEKIAEGGAFRIADLTGGLGVDTWYFSYRASEVLYNEMQYPLYEAAQHNFKELGCSNIRLSNKQIDNSNVSEIIAGFKPDIVYMDPARRGEGGKKVFLIEECTPDVLTLKDIIFENVRHILIKLSPMADITMVCERLGSSCREVHVIGAAGECKELLIWMDREWSGGYSITATELCPYGTHHSFSFTPEEEKVAKAVICSHIKPGDILFEPGKALMKSGAFNSISEKTGMEKLGASTHYYIADPCCIPQDLGKVYRIERCEALNKRSIKSISQEYPKAEVTARNIPMDTDTLRKKLGVTSGGDTHIFGLRSDHIGPLLIVTSRL